MIEEGKRQARYERVNPDAQSREFNGNRIQIHAVDAPPRDLAAQELGVLDLYRVGKRSKRFASRVPQPCKLRNHIRQLALYQVTRKRPLDAVDRGNQEMARTHRYVGDAEIKEGVRRRTIVSDRIEP